MLYVSSLHCNVDDDDSFISFHCRQQCYLLLWQMSLHCSEIVSTLSLLCFLLFVHSKADISACLYDSSVVLLWCANADNVQACCYVAHCVSSFFLQCYLDVFLFQWRWWVLLEHCRVTALHSCVNTAEWHCHTTVTDTVHNSNSICSYPHLSPVHTTCVHGPWKSCPHWREHR